MLLLGLRHLIRGGPFILLWVFVPVAVAVTVGQSMGGHYRSYLVGEVPVGLISDHLVYLGRFHNVCESVVLLLQS